MPDARWEWTGLEAAALGVYLVLFFSAYVAQIVTILRTGSSANVNLSSFARLSLGQFFWTVYSYSLGRIGFFIGSALTFASLVALAVVILVKRGKGVSARRP